MYVQCVAEHVYDMGCFHPLTAFRDQQGQIRFDEKKEVIPSIYHVDNVLVADLNDLDNGQCDVHTRPANMMKTALLHLLTIVNTFLQTVLYGREISRDLSEASEKEQEKK